MRIYKLMIILAVTIVSVACVPQVWAEHTIEGVHASTKQLVLQKDDWTVCFQTSIPTTARIFIYNADMKVVRQLVQSAFKKEHTFSWDGKDTKGQPVPSQIYIYRIRTEDEGGTIHAVDPYLKTAAQDTLSYWGKWQSEEGKIQFNLERDALARVRVGIENGPMVATPAEWIPLRKGEPVVAWDGKDDDGVKDYSNEKNLRVHTDAISLPDNYIFVRNPKSEEPETYVQTRWVRDAVAFNEKIQPKKYRTASSVVEKTREKGILNILPGRAKRSADGMLQIREVEEITISYPRVAEDARDGQLYEIQYYVDGAYVAEDMLQEGDAVYQIDPKKQSRGQHVLVVNAILGAGRIGTASLKYVIEK